MVGDWLTYSRKPGKRISKKLMRDWSEAPPELLGLILSNLFFKDRLIFKLVCRSWNSIIPNTPLLPPPTNSPYFHSPCLIFPQKTSNRWKIFHSVYNDFYYLNFPPELKNAEIMCSKDGWLLMSLQLDQSPLFFFNPLTRERFKLPPTRGHFYSVCFTSPPTSGDCFVFGIIRTEHATGFGLIKFGDEEWELGPIVNRFKLFQQFSHCPPLFYNGVFYCVCFFPRGLRIFDPKKNGGDRWIPNHDVVCIDGDDEELGMEYMRNEFEYYIAEVNGEICCVFVMNDGREVSVVKWDFGRSRWKKLESFGGKCLYVSRTGMFVETCGVFSGMENRIYFNKFRGKSGVLYSLATKMYHSVEGDFASRYAYGLTHAEHGSWIKFSASDKM